MVKVIDGIYQKGVIKLLDKVDLEENEQIRIAVFKRQAKGIGESRSLFGAFPELRGLTDEDEDIEEVKKVWERGLEKQMRILEGDQ
ncbi:MAG: hypothetical protein DDT32_01084 [Syntrophomonadaceae bacterium]|nr:hypothetical protein [Bacillota bacterium]MBT9147330.1 hypothetical protein [Bacillota bacterium]